MVENMKEKTVEVVVAGLTCIDITPIFITPEVEEIGEILIPSKTVLMGKADIHVGGCVSNTGLAMCKFGVNTRLMGKIGDDEFGKIVLQQYSEYTTTENMIISETEGTAYSVVLAPAGIDRIFLHYPGGNETFGADDIDYELVGEAKLFHFGYPPLMRRMYADNGKELLEIFERVQSLGVVTSMDTCGIDEHAEVGRIDWENILRNLMPYLDIFVPSAEELCYMLDKKRFEEWKHRADGKDMAVGLKAEDVAPLAQMLLDWGGKIVMIKCGAAGLYLATNFQKALQNIGGDFSSMMAGWENIRHFENSFKPRKVLSGTGAGDTCIAAFLTAMLRGYPWKKCVEYAAASGAACVETYDALGGLLSFAELDQKIEAGWEKNK